MKIRLLWIASAAVLSTAAVTIRPTADVLKCPPKRAVPSVVRAPGLGGEGPNGAAKLASPAYAASVPVYVLDGKIVKQGAIAATDPDSFESIAVVCSDERHGVFGVEPGRDLVVAFTRPGPHAALRAGLDSVVELQTAYRARHGEFASSPQALGWEDPSGLLSITLTVSDDAQRWSATGTHRYILDGTPMSVPAEPATEAGGRGN